MGQRCGSFRTLDYSITVTNGNGSYTQNKKLVTAQQCTTVL